ncbi:MAG: hypothetical protein ABEI31_01900 [Halodesulfurarchaeum sp.]
MRAWETAAIRELSARVDEAYRDSAIHHLFVLLDAWIRASFLYRWLTKEPEPEVIVIDLRETWTVGPIIAVLDRLVRTFARATPTSTATRAWAGLCRQFRRRPIQVLSLLTLGALSAWFLWTAATGELGTAAFAASAGLAVLALSGLRVTDTLDELMERRAVKLLVAALEPPDVPEAERQNADREEGAKTSPDGENSNS